MLDQGVFIYQHNTISNGTIQIVANPYRYLDLGDLTTRLTAQDDKTILLQAVQTLEPYPVTIFERLKYWAETTPQHTFIAQRDKINSNLWHKVSYREAWDSVRQLASALCQYPLSVDRPLVILSGNSINHALIGLAAMYLGVPYAPVSPQYSLSSSDFKKLKYVLDLVTPGMVYVEESGAYTQAIQYALDKEAYVVSCSGKVEGFKFLPFENLLQTPISAEANNRHQSVRPDTIAKFLFSSGSTGLPKAVINTHKMLAANLQMMVQAYPFLKDQPVLVDWLPWNHTFGGNHNVGIALYNGGSYYIDDGKPVGALFQHTVNTLKEIAPSVYFNVPKGFELLVKHLRKDSQLRELFFSRVKMLFYAGAGISQPVWNALEDLAMQTCGEKILILTGLGCTETAPAALFTNAPGGFAGWIGLPLPGVEVKLKSLGNKIEIRFRGDNVTPGYWRNPELTAKAFDEEGYYCTGDAVKFADDSDPQKGLVFDGRISEDFKLDSGTWVSSGPLRAAFLDHFGTIVKDIVICGRDRSFITALVFPDIDFCRQLLSNNHQAAKLDDTQVLNQAEVLNKFQHLLDSFGNQAYGSSNRIVRISLQAIPPSLDKHEITDKGSLNASAIQDNRSAELGYLYAAELHQSILEVTKI